MKARRTFISAAVLGFDDRPDFADSGRSHRLAGF
jgi:hypothetical protein